MNQKKLYLSVELNKQIDLEFQILVTQMINNQNIYTYRINIFIKFDPYFEIQEKYDQS